ncbi:alpha/beta fold hydrolase [Actinoplanes regularis]|uniref:alpha/beta fold hydrolase n=1 Tax=Actinoplanes regularis TaxID=52697 RepID=UPI0024A53C2A|nr:hypothetical protein [Actinoplanes regularis]GLW33683.1 hypothetical protein Areg01_66210 [Actinoplanes regularis]
MSMIVSATAGRHPYLNSLRQKGARLASGSCPIKSSGEPIRAAARALQHGVGHFLPGLADLRAAPPDLGDLPVTIISAGAAAHALKNGRLVNAEGSGHNVMLDQPALVVAGIERLVTGSCGGGSTPPAGSGQG